MDDPVKPNLLIIGAMKASTTLLYEMLGRHPEVWFSPEKEPHYFTRRDYGTPRAYEQYLALFAGCPPGKSFVGEASTGYTKAPHVGPAAKRIRETLGHPKLIYILRDPLKRTISHYKHSYARGFYSDGFSISRALIEDPIIVGASLYAYQLAAYEAEFGAHSVLVLIAEELHRDPVGVMREVERFLGVASFDGWNAPVITVNTTADVQRAARLDRLFGQATRLRRFARHAPDWLKSAIRQAASTASKTPPITPCDERQIFDLVADDLSRLQAKVGDKIACWPSVRMLSSAPLACSKLPTFEVGARHETEIA